VPRLIFVVLTVLLVLYPLIVYFGLTYFRLEYMAVLLLVVFGIRLLLARKFVARLPVQSIVLIATGGAALCLIAVLLRNDFSLRLYPLLVNMVLAAVFLVSLLKPPTVIERIARLTNPGLSQNAVLHTRRVTIVWLGFFVLNGLVSAYTIFFGDMELWALYNGVISYLLMGVLFAGEYLVRIRLIRRENEARG
jgi:uncharacterized membrane protein